MTENKILLTRLHKAQERDGYVTQAAIDEIAGQLGVPAAEVYQTVSFYSMLYLKPQGKHLIQICESAPCHIAGAQAVIAAMESQLGIRMGETTGDSHITLQYIQCCSQCQDAPVLVVDGELMKCVEAGQVAEILERLK